VLASKEVGVEVNADKLSICWCFSTEFRKTNNTEIASAVNIVIFGTSRTKGLPKTVIFQVLECYI
jgi:hypothetical protein